MEVSATDFLEVHTLNFRILAAILSLARSIEADKATAEAKHDPVRDYVMVLAANRDSELKFLHVSAETPVEEDALALAQRGLRALSYPVIPVAALTLEAGLSEAMHALSHTTETWTEYDDDQTVIAFAKRLIADSDELPLSDLSVDTVGTKWGLYIDPAKFTVAVHAIDENAADPARGILVFVMKAKSSEQLRLSIRVIEDVRALEEIRAKERDSLQSFLGGIAIHFVGSRGDRDRGHRAHRSQEAAV